MANRITTSKFGPTTPLAAAAILSLSTWVVGCGQPDQPPPPGPPQVKVAHPLTRPTVLWDEYTGRMTATDFVEVRARVSGYLEQIHFDEGQMVEKNQELFVIDQRPFNAAVKAAKARVAEAEAEVQEAKSLKASAEAAKRQSTARFALAEANYKRSEKLVSGNAMSQEESDVRKSELLQADADVEAANADIASAVAGIATATAAIETAKANLEAAELDLQYTVVKAPIAGRISNELITTGNLVIGGAGGQADVLTTIVALDPIYCMFNANEQEYVKYQTLEENGTRRSSRNTKNPVLMRTIGEEDYPHLGHMDFVDNRLDTNTGTIQGRAIFRNPHNNLAPGQFAEVLIPGSGQFDALLIPDTAVIADQAKRFVYVIGEGDKTVRREVKLGVIVDGLRQVEEGLTAEDRVVLTNLQKLKPDTAVKVEQIQIEPGEEDALPNEYEAVPESEWIVRNAS